MKQKLRLTTLEVTATQDQFGWGRVTEVRKDLGVFVDTGLPDTGNRCVIRYSP